MAGESGVEVGVRTCVAHVLPERGSWARAAEMCRALIAHPHGGPGGLLGAIRASEGLSSAGWMPTSCRSGLWASATTT